MPKVSVIVPIYNVEEFLAECLESILSQTYQDFELILVDDSSTDNSLAIARKYAEHPKITLYEFSENQGVSVARNYATDRASGEYIAYIDSDDVVGERYLEDMVLAADKYNADLVQSGRLNIRLVNGSWQKFPSESYATEITFYPDDKVRRMREFLNWAYEVTPHHKLIKKELIIKYNFSFELYIGGDFCYMLPLLYYAQKVVFIPSVQYFYRINKSGITLTSNDRYAKRALWSFVTGYKLWDKYLEDMPEFDDNLKRAIRLFYFKTILYSSVRKTLRHIPKQKLYPLFSAYLGRLQQADLLLLLLVYRDFLIRQD